jgi:two-component system NarL family sensor kinase
VPLFPRCDDPAVCPSDESAAADNAAPLDRELLAYDIHDGLAQYLAGAAMHLEACDRSRLDDATAAEVTEALRLIRKADREARRLMEGARPPALDDAGLWPALAMIAVEARRGGTDVRLSLPEPEPMVPEATASAVYRIVHEAVANAVQHAAAHAVRVTISVPPDSMTPDSLRPDGLHIHVCDDGRGFDPGQVPVDRLGLEGIRRRATLLGGTARIESRPGAGATIDVVLPLPPGGG